MKRILILFSLIIILVVQFACKKSPVTAGFEDIQKYTIYDYMVENKAEYSSFLSILEKGGMDKTLSAYNPNGINYTLFLPDNAAVDAFIKNSGQFNSLNDLLNDQNYVDALSRYHVINMGTSTYEFPFGTFSEPTLTGDYLNVNFILGKDTTYYKINNQATVTLANIEVSNGYIQVIGSMLTPITINSYEWLAKNPEYSIFKAAIDAVGLNKVIDVDMKQEGQTLKPFTMLIESDAIYKKRSINNFDDLAKSISPDRTDYTSTTNPLNLFVGYHMLNESKFLDDLAGRSTNYNTFADVPLTINGLGLDIVINKGKEKFINAPGDTTDFVGLYYDESNINTQSGAIHFIDQVLKPQIPSRAIVTFEFWEEQALNKYRIDGGSYLIENEKLLDYVKWSGSKLFYVKSNDDSEQAWSKDYMLIDGDFTISYQVPKIIQGRYDVYLRADAFGSQNALVELYIDGNKIGGLIDLTKGGNASNPYQTIKVGNIDFKKYASHIIEIKSLIPGRLKWDVIRFEPI
ncbi:MAG: fasciclin domain-containing protein [Prolixibacteraceae bacterium]